MKSTQITTSVALFYEAERRAPIPLAWFERALEVLGEHNLAPILFTAAGGQFESDDCYLLADGGGEIYRWSDPAPLPRRSALVDALRTGAIYSLSIDTPRPDSEGRSDWMAKLSVSSVIARLYFGLDEELAADPVALVRRACEMANDLFDVRYGFAYKMPLANQPASYAIGSRPFYLSDFKELMRQKRIEVRAEPNQDDLWQSELMGQRRHVSGYFRGVYRSNVLSAAHVHAAGLRSAPVGKLSEIDDSLWLWEVSEAEIPIAETLLLAKRLLVGQIAEP